MHCHSDAVQLATHIVLVAGAHWAAKRVIARLPVDCRQCLGRDAHRQLRAPIAGSCIAGLGGGGARQHLALAACPELRMRTSAAPLSL